MFKHILALLGMVALISATTSLDFLPDPPTQFQSFSAWSSPYTSTGTVSLHVSIGGNPPVTPDLTLPAKIAVDPVGSRYFIDLTTFQQWTLFNGSYFVSADPNLPPGLCFFNPFGYAGEVLNYKNVLFTGRAAYIGQTGLVDVYEGEVKDAGSCEGVISSSFGVERIRNSIVRWSASQSAPSGPVNGTCGSPTLGLVKVALLINVPNVTPGRPPASVFQLPPQCLSPATLRPYCGPNGFFCFPYTQPGC